MAAVIAYFFITSEMRKKFKKENPGLYKVEYDYTENDFFKQLKTVFLNYHVYGLKLTIDLRYRVRTCVIDPKREDWREIVRTEYWTNEKKSEIHLSGYRKVRGMHDGLTWYGVPVYMKIQNASYFIVPDTKTNGKYDYPQDTAETLHDYASSNATQKFISAMSKASMDTMDKNTIIMIIVLAIGAIFGMHLFGVF